MKTYNPNLSVPEEISRKAAELKTWMEMFGAESIYGMGNVADLQRQLADAQALIANLEGDPEADEDNFAWLPKYARYLIEDYRKKYPK